MSKHAYYVADEESADIVFAEDEQQAIAIGAYRISFGDMEGITAKLIPFRAKFSPLGYVPPEALIASGWWQPCDECGCRVDEDNEQEHPETGEEYYPDPVFDGRLVFCCQGCADTYRNNRDRHQDRKAKAQEFIMARFPDAQTLKLCGSPGNYPLYATFRLPGLRYPVNWNDRDDGFSINGADKDNWERRKAKECDRP